LVWGVPPPPTTDIYEEPQARGTIIYTM
jgi:hypothetical protein